MENGASRLSSASVSEIFIPMGTFRRCLYSEVFPDAFRLLSYTASPSHPLGTLMVVEPSLFSDARIVLSNGERYMFRPVLIQESVLNSLPMISAPIQPELHSHLDSSDHLCEDGFRGPPVLPDLAAVQVPISPVSSESSAFLRRGSVY